MESTSDRPASGRVVPSQRRAPAAQPPPLTIGRAGAPRCANGMGQVANWPVDRRCDTDKTQVSASHMASFWRVLYNDCEISEAGLGGLTVRPRSLVGHMRFPCPRLDAVINREQKTIPRSIRLPFPPPSARADSGGGGQRGHGARRKGADVSFGPIVQIWQWPC